MAAPALADYPFDTWNGFFSAFKRSLQSEFYGDEYPGYKREQDERGGNAVDVSIVEALLANGASPQDGFDGLIQAVLNGDRYAHGLRNGYLSSLFQPILARGVILNLAPIFAATNPPPAPETRVGTMGDDWEEEANSNYKARGVLLDELADAMDKQELGLLDASQFYDFDSIPAAEWEDEDIGGILFEKARMMILKGQSEFLGGNPRGRRQGGKRMRSRSRRSRTRRSRTRRSLKRKQTRRRHR